MNNIIKDINDLKKLPEIIEGLIEVEIGEKHQQLKELNKLKMENRNTINKLENENKRLNNLGKDKSNLLKALDILVKDGILEFVEDGDVCYDEYGNGGGFHEISYIYKGKIIYRDGESF